MLHHAVNALPNVVYCCIAPETGDACVGEHGGGEIDCARPQRTSRYTRSLLRQTMQMMGCKPRHADKACDKLFLILQQRAALAPAEPLSLASTQRELRPGVAAVTLRRPQFEALVAQCLQAHDPGAPLPDFRIACALQERRSSVVVLLCGTSGTGKSTLASLLAARLGIATVVSTDSIRQMMCSFAPPEQQALLRLSTYQAGEAVLLPPRQTLDPAQQPPAPAADSNPLSPLPPVPDGNIPAGGGIHSAGTAANGSGGGSSNSVRAQRVRAMRGYLAQCEAVMSHVSRLVAGAQAERRCLVLEGVHLSPQLVARLVAACPCVVPFLVHISNEAKHLERFAVRAKTMTLRPERNRYVRHLRSIRAIQAELCAAADRRGVPRVDNTNVDRSLATIHATVLGCLRRAAAGEALMDPATGRCSAVLEEYTRCTAATWSGRGALELIRRKAAEGQGGSSPEGPSTSAATTPQGPLSEVGEAAAAAGGGQASFYGSDASASSQGGSDDDGGRGAGAAAAGAGDGGGGTGGGGACAGRDDQRDSALGSVLETDAASEDTGGGGG